MTLNQLAAELRLQIYEDLKAGRAPSTGTYDEVALKEARTKGSVQMGTTRFLPGEMAFEFIFPDPQSTALILTVHAIPPERIVFMPVPSWVVENIWQGDIAGTYHFESEARRLVAELTADLEPGANDHWFEKQTAKRRE